MPKPPRIKKLGLKKLCKGYPCLQKHSCVRLASAAAVCFEEQSHTPGVFLGVKGDKSAIFEIDWSLTTDQLKREWTDPQEATENGAVAIAILLVDEMTEYQIIQRSYKSTGIDYWLGKRDELLLQNAARLEVSGIRKGDDRVVNTRVKAKIKQSEQSKSSGLPLVVVVVEFGNPHAIMVVQ